MTVRADITSHLGVGFGARMRAFRGLIPFGAGVGPFKACAGDVAVSAALVGAVGLSAAAAAQTVVSGALSAATAVSSATQGDAALSGANAGDLAPEC